MSNVNEEVKSAKNVFYVSQTRSDYENQNECIQGGVDDKLLNSVKKGDVIIHYQHVQPGNKGKRQIAAVSVATGETEVVDGVDDEGRPFHDLRVKVKLYKLKNPFGYDREKNAEMVKNADGKIKNLPFNINGTGVQHYISIMTEEMAEYYLGLIMKNEPEVSDILK